MTVTVRHGRESSKATLTNISSGGAAVVLDKPLRFGTLLSICFTVPGSQNEVEFPGRVAWSNRDGEHGIQFGELPAGARSDLERWLQSRMETGVAQEHQVG